MFDILFVRELNSAHIVECLHCARRFTASRSFKGYAVLAEHPLSTLHDIYRAFVNDKCIGDDEEEHAGGAGGAGAAEEVTARNGTANALPSI